MNHIMNQNEEKNDPGTLIKQIASHWSSCLADRLDVDPLSIWFADRNIIWSNMRWWVVKIQDTVRSQQPLQV